MGKKARLNKIKPDSIIRGVKGTLFTATFNPNAGVIATNFEKSFGCFRSNDSKVFLPFFNNKELSDLAIGEPVSGDKIEWKTADSKKKRAAVVNLTQNNVIGGRIDPNPPNGGGPYPPFVGSGKKGKKSKKKSKKKLKSMMAHIAKVTVTSSGAYNSENLVLVIPIKRGNRNKPKYDSGRLRNGKTYKFDIVEFKDGNKKYAFAALEK